jgi:glucose/arabinose dehydrogenase
MLSWTFEVTVALLLLLNGCGSNTGTNSQTSPTPPAPPTPPGTSALSPLVRGLVSPIGLESPDDGTNRLFVLEQAGTIRIIENGSIVPTPFLDITSKVESGGEEGLLGLAFHPNFTADGRFYVNYTHRVSSSNLVSVIAEYKVSGTNTSLADANSERQLLVIQQQNDTNGQPFPNHKGGQLAFGPDDGLLYIALGDGGGAGDPFGNGQNTNARLGKLLRIGVDPANGKPYTLPVDNPFLNGLAPEIFAYGLRNPWRFSFDRGGSHQLFAGDVGQSSWEEVDIITKGGNYGWNIMEGDHCFNPPNGCLMANLILPITEYDHSMNRTAIIGGFVYRGVALPNLVGTYIFGDLTSGEVWGLKQDASGNWQQTLLLKHNLTVSSFGQDAAGELYLVDYGNGVIYRLFGTS